MNEGTDRLAVIASQVYRAAIQDVPGTQQARAGHSTLPEDVIPSIETDMEESTPTQRSRD